ncbi:MAG: S-adenosylmethionine:tRNA ribosyltransferase-isomerase [Bacteroidales bacterium]|nr:S-adenosylmethionine:tRNA ribosyltransferase-isomerase [Bacteroidales bacterium]MDD3906820.1 S-adenosylmethionine:tRNA ribosyltransferase-isomerase [Bacteroidales bacterium]MDD4713143.1 S-adenosylmethionine:tRNA ribosyltransferase-isomerase [Bacteroidales bacterium]
MKDLLEKIESIRIEDYTYSLEDERIAKFPVEPRDASKLLIYRKGNISEAIFRDLPNHLEEKSMLVYNNTKVIHARLFFHKETGARIEVFCLEPLTPVDYAQNFQSTGSCEWLCMVGNLKKWKKERLERELSVNGKRIQLTAEKLATENKAHRIRFTWQDLDPVENGDQLIFGDLLEAAGQLPIPPYLNRATEASDEITYQTVFSKIEGSVAAPTAGLHFTPEVLSAIDQKNILRTEVTLHVGAGTFQPVLSEQIADHVMHSEFISVDRSFLLTLIHHIGHITAVGTTSVRTLESLYWFGYKLIKSPEIHPDEWTLDQWYAYKQMTAIEKSPHNINVDAKDALKALVRYLDQNGLEVFTASTRLLIAPGFRFHLVNAMLTNFHQPNSTLLLLVSAFLGGDEWKKIYDYALSHQFRFLSYGDSSLLVP